MIPSFTNLSVTPMSSMTVDCFSMAEAAILFSNHNTVVHMRKAYYKNSHNDYNLLLSWTVFIMCFPHMNYCNASVI